MENTNNNQNFVPQNTENNQAVTQEIHYEPTEYEVACRKAIASMVLGIIALVFCLLIIVTIWSFIPAFILSIIGIVNSITSKNMGCYNGQRKAGYVCSLIALIFSSVFVFLFVIALFVVAGATI